NHFYYSMLTSLARHYGFDIDAPWEMLEDKTQQLILYGSGKEKIAFHYVTERSRSQVREHAFEGVLPNLERRYRETDSVVMREELARYSNTQSCMECGGTRLRREARHVKAEEKTIYEISSLPLRKTLEFFKHLKQQGAKQQIAERIVREIANRLEFLVNVGLDYLALARAPGSRSGGESQRTRIGSQIGSGLTAVMYVLDEPSIGLHQRDNARLIETLKRLRDIGNSVIVVEHDEEAILTADYVVDIGPGAGVHGGHIVAEGTPEDILRAKGSITGQYLSGKLQIPTPPERRKAQKGKKIHLDGATGNNLKNVSV